MPERIRFLKLSYCFSVKPFGGAVSADTFRDGIHLTQASPSESRPSARPMPDSSFVRLRFEPLTCKPFGWLRSGERTAVTKDHVPRHGGLPLSRRGVRHQGEYCRGGAGAMLRWSLRCRLQHEGRRRRKHYVCEPRFHITLNPLSS